MASSLPFFLLHPLAHNILQALLSIGVLGFTHPTSAIRTVAVLLSCVFPLLLFFPSYPVFDHSRPLSAFFAGNTLGFFLQFLDAGIISRWSFDARAPTSPKGGMPHIVKYNHDPSHSRRTKDRPNRAWLERLAFGSWIALPLGPRLVNTRWQVTGTPDFPARRVPSRSKLLWRASLRLIACLLIFDLVGIMNGKDDPANNKKNQELFDWSRVPFFARFSAIDGQEIMVRIGVSFFMWLIGYCVVQAIYSAMEIVALGSGLTEVEGWKPLFGSLSDCWSIRQFWGSVMFFLLARCFELYPRNLPKLHFVPKTSKYANICAFTRRFWHQSLRLRIGNPAHYLIYHLFGFRKGSITGRYAMLFTVFFISGLFHLAEDVSEGMNWRDSGSFRYYCMQPIGIMLEDAVQNIYRRNFKSEGKARRQKPWERTIGYLWFFAWMTWTTPAWVYPKALLAKGGQQDQILPFSILGIIL